MGFIFYIIKALHLCTETVASLQHPSDSPSAEFHHREEFHHL